MSIVEQACDSAYPQKSVDTDREEAWAEVEVRKETHKR